MNPTSLVNTELAGFAVCQCGSSSRFTLGPHQEKPPSEPRNICFAAEQMLTLVFGHHLSMIKSSNWGFQLLLGPI